MIIVDLLGGLGNQLFQYAAGKSLATKLNVELKIYTGRFQSYTLQNYSLNHFNISAPQATEEEVKRYNNTLIKIRERFSPKPYYTKRVVREQGFQFDENFYKVKDNSMLSGYWQSEKYFQNVEAQIRDEFTIKTAIDEINRKCLNDIKNSNAISLHIRRGDYVKDAKTNKVHGTTSMAYYNFCVNEIAKMVNDPVFFIFSDDPEWVKTNLKWDYPMVFIDHNGVNKNYEDLRLMSLCKHNIIANSSFSWWGAWLNGNKNKTVFAPQKWFNISTRGSSDIIPGEWRKV